MRTSLFASVLLVVSLCIACSSVRTHYDFDPNADFSSWRTYTWYPTGPPQAGDPRLDNPLLHARIEAAVNRTLDARGYSRVEDPNRSPDFYVNYHLSTEQRTDVVTMNRAYTRGPHGRGWYGRGWSGVGWTETRVDQFEEGSLVIDFVDVPRRSLAWRGTGTRRLPRRPQPDRMDQLVNEAVEEILDQFPPNP